MKDKRNTRSSILIKPEIDYDKELKADDIKKILDLLRYNYKEYDSQFRKQ